VAPPPLFVRNTEIVYEAPGSDEFLRLSPRGSYTGMRTVNRTGIFRLSQHIERLATSFQTLLSHATDLHDSSSQLAPLCDPRQLRAQLVPIIRKAVTAYCEQDDSFPGEMKISVVMPLVDSPTIFCHVSALGQRPSQPVSVQLVKTHRNDPQVKDSQWVKERAQFTPVTDINEYLLLTEDGRITEGSSSNFFVVIRGAVHTAGSDVLVGTVQKTVETLCAEQHIPYVLRTPLLDESHSWDEAFLASTSRWVLPIRTIYCLEGDQVQLPKTELGDKLATLVMERAVAETEEF